MKNWHEWNKQKAHRLLIRIYHWLKTSDVLMGFSTKYCRTTYEEPCDGFNWYVEGKLVAILFDPRPSQPLVVVIIHELVHAIYPDLEEYQVAHIAEEVSKYLSDKQITNLLKRFMEKIK